MMKQPSIVPELRFSEFENDGDWEETTLDKVCNLNYGERITQKKSLGVKYPVYGGGGESFRTDSYNRENEFVISRFAMSVNCVRYVFGKFWMMDSGGTISINEDYKIKIDKTFIGYLFVLIESKIYLLARGQAQKNLDTKAVKKIPISIPPSTKEQQKIANCLSLLDTLITAATEKLDYLKDHKKGLLQELFPANGETKPQFRFSEFEDDGDWKEDKLSNLVLNISPPKKLKSSQFQENGKYPIIDQSQNEIAGWSDDEKALVKNDFPLIVFGDHTCALKIVESPFIQGADGIKILKGDTLIDTRYLFYALQCNSLIMKEYKRHYSILKDKIISYSNINTGEQQKIANCISSLDDLIEAQKTKIKTLKNHKKGLMQQLFPNINELAV